jgi:hypothetical protein
MKGTVDIFESFARACEREDYDGAAELLLRALEEIAISTKGLICPVSGDVGQRFQSVMKPVKEYFIHDGDASSFSVGDMGQVNPRIFYVANQVQTRDTFMRVRFHEGIHAAQARSNPFHFLNDFSAPLVCEPYSRLRLCMMFEMEAIIKAEWLMYLASTEFPSASKIKSRKDLVDFLYNKGLKAMDPDGKDFHNYENYIFAAYAISLEQRINSGYPVRRYYRLTAQDLQACGNTGILPNLWGTPRYPIIPEFAWSDDIVRCIDDLRDLIGIPDENEVPTLTEALAEEGFSLAKINCRLLAGERLSAIWGDRAVQQGPADPEAEPYPAHRPN